MSVWGGGGGGMCVCVCVYECYWISSLDTASNLATFTRKKGADFVLTLIYFWTKSVENWQIYEPKNTKIGGVLRAVFTIAMGSARGTVRANNCCYGPRARTVQWPHFG